MMAASSKCNDQENHSQKNMKRHVREKLDQCDFQLERILEERHENSYTL
jgi:hypothetical protein